MPSGSRSLPDWTEAAETIEREFDDFWDRLRPGIACEDIQLLTTDRITLARLEPYQRFDADWVSFEDETPVISIEADLRS